MRGFLQGEVKTVTVKENQDGFNCPHCGAYAHQRWGWAGVFPEILAHTQGGGISRGHGHPEQLGDDIRIARCARCSNFSLWVKSAMVYPESMSVSAPNEDLPDNIKVDYMEAASVLQKSPRAAAALLRLALQKLCKHLGGEGKSIHDDIGLLVKVGLPESVLKAMDAVRIIGNNAVHPGQLDMDDNAEIAAKLFRLINFIAEKTLTDAREVDEIYEGLPDSQKRKNRDNGE